MRYRSARQMVFQAYQCHPQSTMAGVAEKARLGVEIQETRRQNCDARIAHGLEAGAVIARVEALPPHLQALVRFCFGPFTREEVVEDSETCQLELYRRLVTSSRRLPGQGRDGKPTADTLIQAYWLCAAAVFHHGETTWPYRRPGLPSPRAVTEWLSAYCGVTLQGRWRHSDRASWHDIWEVCLRELDEWEGQGLAPVAALLESDKQARREEYLA